MQVALAGGFTLPMEAPPAAAAAAAAALHVPVAALVLMTAHSASAVLTGLPVPGFIEWCAAPQPAPADAVLH